MSAAVTGHGHLSLQQQCLLHILMHLEQFPASFLALLPHSLCQELLINLPIADVCMLEESPFVHGMDMEDFWRGLITSEPCLADLYPEDVYPGAYEAMKAISATSKARCYGLVAGYIVHNSTSLHSSFGYYLSVDIKLDNTTTERWDKIIKFLYAVKKFASRDEHHWYSLARVTYRNCEFLFPSHYVQFQRCYCSSSEMVDAVVHGFRGLPQILITSGFGRGQRNITLDFLSELTYLHGDTLDQAEINNNVVAVAKMATNFKVLAMSHGCRTCSHCDTSNNELSVSLNEFCAELSFHLPFLSNIHLLLVESHEETVGFDTGFVVSQQNLEDFLRAFLSTPCSHPQKIKFSRITVEDFHIPPDSTQPVSWQKLATKDQHYLHLKTVEFEDSCFKHQQVTLKQIASWAGQEVHNIILNRYESQATSFSFKGSRKRPHSEN